MALGQVATALGGILLGAMLGFSALPMPMVDPEPAFVFDAVKEEQVAKFLNEKFGPLPPSAIPDEWRGPPVLGILRDVVNPRSNTKNLPLDRD